jgi:hypothetical protein
MEFRVSRCNCSKGQFRNRGNTEWDHRTLQGENPAALSSVGQEAVDFEFSQHG